MGAHVRKLKVSKTTLSLELDQQGMPVLRNVETGGLIYAAWIERPGFELTITSPGDIQPHLKLLDNEHHIPQTRPAAEQGEAPAGGS